MAALLTIWCDGGIKGKNPGGFGYGSFCEYDEDTRPNVRRVEFGNLWFAYPMTSILAELLTLTEALRYFAERPGYTKRHVIMRCDCRWVVRHLSVKKGRSVKAHLVLAHHDFHEVAKQFPTVNIKWHRRTNSVAVLGH